MKSTLLKTSARVLLCSVLLFGLTQCDKLLEAFNIDSPFSTNVIINISESDDLIFVDEQEIDLSSNSDFNDNKDKIENFTINSVYYKVVDYVGEPGILGSGTIIFKDGNTQLGEAISQSNIDFNALYISGEKVDIPISDATINAIQTTLKDKMKITVSMEGLVTDKPVYADLEVFIVVTAKVSP